MFKAISVIFGVALSFSTVAFAGPGSTGGGYMDFNGKMILNATLNELSTLVTSIQTPSLKTHPERRLTMFQALNSLKVHSQETRYRNGQALVMDFDLGHQQIIVLKPFFEGFQTSAVSQETVRSAKQLLIHEIAHLWGADDIEADQFAGEFIDTPSPKRADPLAALKSGDYVSIPAGGSCGKHVEVDLDSRRVYVTRTGCKIGDGDTVTLVCAPDSALDCKSISGGRTYTYGTDYYYYAHKLSALPDGNFNFTLMSSKLRKDGSWSDPEPISEKYSPNF